MEEIIKVSIVEAEKSSYKMELKRASNGYLYITINQAIFSYIDDAKLSKVKIRASNLDEIIRILNEFQDEIFKQKPEKRVFNPLKKQQILDRYLNKRMEIKTLAIQFGCSFNDIAQLLIDENIQLVSNNLPGEKLTRRRRQRKSSE